MPKYENAVIYKLCCKDASITDEYIGSTCNKYKRKQGHKRDCNNKNRKGYDSPVYQFIRANGGFENWDLIVLEEYSCESKVQLEMKEREWIELRKPTLNRNVPTRTSKEYNDTYKEEHRQYYQEHREERLQYLKQYQEEHIEEIKERRKQYYEENKDEINENQRIKIMCECGIEVNNSSLSRHRKSQKHLKYLEELNL